MELAVDAQAWYPVLYDACSVMVMDRLQGTSRSPDSGGVSLRSSVKR